MKYIKYEPTERIIKEYFWDYKVPFQDLKDYISSDDWWLKKFVFDKVFCNSQYLIIDLMIFEKEDFVKLIKEYKISQFILIIWKKSQNNSSFILG